MPKQHIYGQDPDFHVVVGWQRLGGVQVATQQTNDEADPAPARGFYVDLTRDNINYLIRSLRKARDQAYGADA